MGITIMSKKVQCIPVPPTPQPPGLEEQTSIADGGQGLQGALQSHISLGRGDVNLGAGDSNQVHNTSSGKRLTDIQPIPDSPARLLIQGIGKNQQAKQAPLWNSMQEGDADRLARSGEGLGTLQWNTTINVENPATMAKIHPQDRAWGSIRILTWAHKPSLASLARPQSASGKVSRGQGNQDNVNSSTMRNATVAPASGLPGFSSLSGDGKPSSPWRQCKRPSHPPTPSNPVRALARQRRWRQAKMVP